MSNSLTHSFEEEQMVDYAESKDRLRKQPTILTKKEMVESRKKKQEEY
jgi:hypothetical protein